CVHITASFFFFQAEDGIRDPLVTGVQTCALPISCASRAGQSRRSSPSGRARGGSSTLGSRPAATRVSSSPPPARRTTSLRSWRQIGRASCRKECMCRLWRNDSREIEDLSYDKIGV